MSKVIVFELLTLDGVMQERTGQGSRRTRQQKIGPGANATQSRRRVCTPDPSADSGSGEPPLHRR
jgi:hypothetical protein